MALRLGDILIQQGVIDEAKLTAALSDQLAFGGKLGRTLVDLGYVSEEQLVDALATQRGLEPDSARTDAIAELRTLLVRLEKQLSAQGRAFRALVEILQEKGIVRRGELGTQTTKSK